MENIQFRPLNKYGFKNLPISITSMCGRKCNQLHVFMDEGPEIINFINLLHWNQEGWQCMVVGSCICDVKFVHNLKKWLIGVGLFFHAYIQLHLEKNMNMVKKLLLCKAQTPESRVPGSVGKGTISIPWLKFEFKRKRN